MFNIFLSQIISFIQYENLSTELIWNFLQIRGLGDEVLFVAALFVAFIPFFFFIGWYETSVKLSGGDRKFIVVLLVTWTLSRISNMYSRIMPEDILLWGEFCSFLAYRV